MKALIYCFSICSIVSFKLQSQDLSQDQINQDYNYLIDALEEGHPGIYWYNSKQEFDKTAEDVETSLDKVSNVKELQSLFTDINNVISCGHTAILLPDSRYKEIDSLNLFLPFNIIIVEQKVLVAESFTTSLSRGDQVLSINDKPIDELMAELQRFIPIDKGITSKRDRSIEVNFPYSYALYKGSPAKFIIEIKKGAKEKKIRKEVDAISIHEKMFKSVRDFAPAQVPIRLSFDNSKQAAILKLATFGRASFKANKINFQDTVRGVFDYLETNKVNNLIIDLRWNNGGTMPLAEYLFSFFIGSTHQFYNDAEVNQPIMEGASKYGRSRNMKLMMEKQLGILEPKDGIYYLPGNKFLVDPTKPQFKGNLYLLTNGFSFSATSAFISLIQENKLGLVVGETPGGAFDGLNAGPPMMVELPNSKIRLYYRIIGTHYNVEEGKTKTAVDIKMDNTLEAFTNGTDVQMDYVLERLKK